MVQDSASAADSEVGDMRVPDEIAGEAVPDRGPGTNLEVTIRQLLNGQLKGVLCTQGQGQPYGSLVACA